MMAEFAETANNRCILVRFAIFFDFHTVTYSAKGDTAIANGILMLLLSIEHQYLSFKSILILCISYFIPP